MTKDEIIIAQQARIEQLNTALNKFLDSHEECTDFDGFTAYIVSMDDFHDAQEEALSTPDDLYALLAHDEKLLGKYRWIPVTEKLPDAEVSVLVARDGITGAQITCHTGREWLLESNHFPVKYWMPCPMTPQSLDDWTRMSEGIQRNLDRAEAIEKGGE